MLVDNITKNLKNHIDGHVIHNQAILLLRLLFFKYTR